MQIILTVAELRELLGVEAKTEQEPVEDNKYTQAVSRAIQEAIEPEKEPEEKQEQPKEEKPKVKRGRPKKEQPIDKGKVMALRRAGWDVKMIADEMGIDEAKVLGILQEVA